MLHFSRGGSEAWRGGRGFKMAEHYVTFTAQPCVLKLDHDQWLAGDAGRQSVARSIRKMVSERTRPLVVFSSVCYIILQHFSRIHLAWSTKDLNDVSFFAPANDRLKAFCVFVVVRTNFSPLFQ